MALRNHPAATIERMVELKAAGFSAEAIALQLRAEGHASAAGLTRHDVAGILRRHRSSGRDVTGGVEGGT